MRNFSLSDLASETQLTALTTDAVCEMFCSRGCFWPKGRGGFEVRKWLQSFFTVETAEILSMWPRESQTNNARGIAEKLFRKQGRRAHANLKSKVLN